MIRQASESILVNSAEPLLRDPEETERLKNESGERCIQLLITKSKEKVRVAVAWNCFMVLFGKAIHRNPILNTLLSLSESNFNAADDKDRMEAFRSWRRLIFNFSLQNHINHVKRIHLIMLPLQNGLIYENSELVRKEVIKSLVYLIMIMSFYEGEFLRRDILKNLQKEVLKRKDCRETVYSICLNLLLSKGNTEIDPMKNLRYIDSPEDEIYLHFGESKKRELLFVSCITILETAIVYETIAENRLCQFWKCLHEESKASLKMSTAFDNLRTKLASDSSLKKSNHYCTLTN